LKIGYWIGGIILQKIKIKLINISKSFPLNHQLFPVLNNISLDVFEKEFLSIVGPSGCGKTTLIRIIAGLEKPSIGSVMLNGEELKGPSKKIGYVPQEFSLFPWRTVKGNISFGLELNTVGKKEREKKINELLELTKLKGFENFYPKDISGGMKQKVAIARALAIDQEVLLLDEPLISIDAQNRNKLQEDLIEIWQKSGRTIIFVTHNLSDRIVVLSKRPASIIEIKKINIPRPRNRTSKEFNEIRAYILKKLEI